MVEEESTAVALNRKFAVSSIRNVPENRDFHGPYIFDHCGEKSRTDGWAIARVYNPCNNHKAETLNQSVCRHSICGGLLHLSQTLNHTLRRRKHPPNKTETMDDPWKQGTSTALWPCAVLYQTTPVLYIYHIELSGYHPLHTAEHTPSMDR